MAPMLRLLATILLTTVVAFAQSDRPNILFAISDDQSAMHAGAYGDTSNKTPAFDRIAREGVLFNYAYTAAPSCAPSRSAILTGRNIWEVEEGGILLGILRAKFTVFTILLEDSGYELGATGKTWGPGRLEGWTRNPFGKNFDAHQIPDSERRPGLRPTDYAKNFDEFHAQRDPSKPFFFWLGTSEPHQSYDVGAWKRAGKKLADARLPKFLPDTPEVRGEILDYGLEIEHFDNHLGRALKTLEDAGELDNTLVIVTSDHGNPLPRSKCNLYDGGTQVPLAIRYPKKIPEAAKSMTSSALLIWPRPCFRRPGLKFTRKCRGAAFGRSCNLTSRESLTRHATLSPPPSSATLSPAEAASATRCARFVPIGMPTFETTSPTAGPPVTPIIMPRPRDSSATSTEA